MSETLRVVDEAARLAVLHQYQILDTTPETAFDDIARLAAFCCQSPMAAINFITADQVWAKARVGLPAAKLSRSLSICTYTLLSEDLCIIPDTTQDPRLVNNPLIAKPLSVRFYAGIPLLTPEGAAIGTLCVMDVTPRTISPEQQNALHALARQVTTQLTARRSVHELQREVAERQAAEEKLHKSQQALSLFVEQTLFPVVSVDTNFQISDWNPAAEKVFGLTRSEVLGRHPSGLLFPETFAAHIEESRQTLLAHKQTLHGPGQITTRDGRTLICEWYVTPLVDAAGEVIGFTALAQDVTDAVRSTQALQASEARFRALFEAAPMAICITRGEELLYANPAAAAMFGVPGLGQWHDVSVLDFLATETQALYLERFARRLHGEPLPPVVEGMGKRADGSVFPMQVQTSQIMLEDGLAVITFVTDVTESKRARAELENSLALLRATLDSTADGILVLDLTGNVLNYNQRFVEMWRISTELLAANGMAQTLDLLREQLDDPADYTSRVGAIFSQPDADSFDEISFRDGRVFERHTQPVRIAGESVGRVASYRDITKRRQAEESLRQSEALLRGIIDNAPLTIFVKTLDGRYLLVNRAWEMGSGYTQAQSQGKTNLELFGQELAERYHAWDQAVIDTGKILEFEDQWTKDDGLHIYSCTRALLADEMGHPYAIIGISTDITDQRQLEEQLQQAQKMEAIGRLAGGVAHDFNNILTIIYSASSLARRRLDDEARVRRYLDEIQKASERAASLIQQLLAFSRKQVVLPRILSLHTLLTGMEEMIKRLVGESIQVQLQVAPDLATIQADPNQIEQVLLNLAANARDAMPNGGVLLISTHTITRMPLHPPAGAAAIARPYVQLAVVDSGQGIDPAVLPHIFEPFFTTKAAGKGTGLGLATVYGIVRQNGGEIQVESQVGRGTTVRILLPAVIDRPQSSSNRPAGGATPLGTETVLVVEDQEAVRQTTVEILTEHGYQVLAAESAEAALHLHATHPGGIDLLLTDVVMPVTSGSELAAQLRTQAPGLKVLYMSGHTEDEEIMRGVRNEQVTLLQKPFTQDELLQQLRVVLDR